MRLHRWTQSSLLASAALLPFPLTSAQATPPRPAERTLFTWSSTVDREVVIQVHGRDVATRGTGMDASFSPRLNVNQPLPRVPGVIHARMENGRGDVEVLENPSPRNDFTATLRVRDTRGGADQYRVVVSFDAENGGDYGRDERNGSRGDGNGDYGRDRNDRGGYDPRVDGAPGRPGYDPRGDHSGNDRPGYDPRDDRANSRNDGRSEHGWYDRNRRDAGALRWRGLVDGVAEIRVQGNRVEALSVAGQRLRDVRYDVLGAALPRHPVRVELAGGDGRGTVRVVQQPSPFNGWVAVIRIEDRRGGYGAYDFDVRW